VSSSAAMQCPEEEADPALSPTDAAADLPLQPPFHATRTEVVDSASVISAECMQREPTEQSQRPRFRFDEIAVGLYKQNKCLPDSHEIQSTNNMACPQELLMKLCRPSSVFRSLILRNGSGGGIQKYGITEIQKYRKTEIWNYRNWVEDPFIKTVDSVVSTCNPKSHLWLTSW
jgi:hypothetical protein